MNFTSHQSTWFTQVGQDTTKASGWQNWVNKNCSKDLNIMFKLKMEFGQLETIVSFSPRANSFPGSKLTCKWWQILSKAQPKSTMRNRNPRLNTLSLFHNSNCTTSSIDTINFIACKNTYQINFAKFSYVELDVVCMKLRQL